MRGKQIKLALAPLALAAGLSACASNGVAPGYVTGPSNASATSSNYGTPTGEAGRVVSINEVALRGGGGGGGPGGMSNSAVSGGLIGAAGGTAIGAVASRSVGGALIGAVLGAVGGAIAGTIVDRQGGGATGRGIEVTVQKDDGQTVKVAQRDEGDIQLGDRVQIVQDRSGTARAVHDNSRRPDDTPQNNGPPSGQDSGPPPQQNAGNSQQYVPRGQNYQPPQDSQQSGNYNQQSGNYSQPSGNYSQSGTVSRPQDDPRNGNLD